MAVDSFTEFRIKVDRFFIENGIKRPVIQTCDDSNDSIE